LISGGGGEKVHPATILRAHRGPLRFAPSSRGESAASPFIAPLINNRRLAFSPQACATDLFQRAAGQFATGQQIGGNRLHRPVAGGEFELWLFLLF